MSNVEKATKKDGEQKPLSTLLPEATIDTLRDFCKEEGRVLSWGVNEAISSWLETNRKD